MTSTIRENLKATIRLTQEMSEKIAECDWQAISQLEADRVILLKALTPESVGLEQWKELISLNRDLVLRLKEARNSRIDDCLQMKRNRKNLSNYQSTP